MHICKNLTVLDGLVQRYTVCILRVNSVAHIVLVMENIWLMLACGGLGKDVLFKKKKKSWLDYFRDCLHGKITSRAIVVKLC